MNTSLGDDTPSSSALDRLFAPGSVALVGASDRSFLAKTVWRAIEAGGFKGNVFPVNPGRTEVFGVPCYPSLDTLPGPIDLCLIAVSEQAALGVLEECTTRGVASAMLFTIFSNTPEGRERRACVRSFLQHTTMAVSGSGTFGLINLDAAFMPLLGVPPNTMHGNIALVCQSGGILNAVSRCLRVAGVGLTKAIATGGEDQLGAADYIDYLLGDDTTRAIGCVLEQIKNIGEFRRACERAREQSVSVVVLNVGRSEKGQQAAFAHSGSLASNTRIIDGLLSQVGAIPVSNLTEMVNVLSVLSRLRPGSLGRRAAIVTISGGETGLAADLADKHGITLPDLRRSTGEGLKKILQTPDAEYQNPVDTALGSLLVLSRPEVYVESVRAALADPEVDFVVARHLEQEGVFDGLAACAELQSKPLFLYTRTVHEFFFLSKDVHGAPLLVLADMELAFSALGKIVQHDEERVRHAALNNAVQANSPETFELTLRRPPSGILMEDEVFPLLSRIGMQTPPLRVLHRDFDIDIALNGVDGPYIAKIISDSIVHRRSAGGVRMDLQTPADVARVAQEFFARFASSISAVVVEPMVPIDVEFILGAKRLEGGNLAIMLGFGGTFVEDLQGVALRLSPLTEWDAEALVKASGIASAIVRLAGERSSVVIAKLKA